MNPGEVWLSYFPFGGRVGTKLRPVLLLTGHIGPIPEILVAYMTSILVPPSQMLPSDIILDPKQPEHASTGLKKPSLLRLHKLATVHESDASRRLGRLSANTMREVEDRLRLLLNL